MKLSPTNATFEDGGDPPTDDPVGEPNPCQAAQLHPQKGIPPATNHSERDNPSVYTVSSGEYLCSPSAVTSMPTRVSDILVQRRRNASNDESTRRLFHLTSVSEVPAQLIRVARGDAFKQPAKADSTKREARLSATACRLRCSSAVTSRLYSAWDVRSTGPCLFDSTEDNMSRRAFSDDDSGSQRGDAKNPTPVISLTNITTETADPTTASSHALTSATTVGDSKSRRVAKKRTKRIGIPPPQSPLRYQHLMTRPVSGNRRYSFRPRTNRAPPNPTKTHPSTTPLQPQTIANYLVNDSTSPVSDTTTSNETPQIILSPAAATATRAPPIVDLDETITCVSDGEQLTPQVRDDDVSRPNTHSPSDDDSDAYYSIIDEAIGDTDSHHSSNQASATSDMSMNTIANIMGLDRTPLPYDPDMIKAGSLDDWLLNLKPNSIPVTNSGPDDWRTLRIKIPVAPLLRCPLCSWMVYTIRPKFPAASLLSHLKLTHNVNVDLVASCRFCGVIGDPEGITRHSRSHQRDPHRPNPRNEDCAILDTGPLPPIFHPGKDRLCLPIITDSEQPAPLSISNVRSGFASITVTSRALPPTPRQEWNQPAPSLKTTPTAPPTTMTRLPTTPPTPLLNKPRTRQHQAKDTAPDVSITTRDTNQTDPKPAEAHHTRCNCAPHRDTMSVAHEDDTSTTLLLAVPLAKTVCCPHCDWSSVYNTGTTKKLLNHFRSVHQRQLKLLYHCCLCGKTLSTLRASRQHHDMAHHQSGQQQQQLTMEIPRHSIPQDGQISVFIKAPTIECLRCPLCSWKLNASQAFSIQPLDRHMRRKHRLTPTFHYECRSCNMTDSLQALIPHYKSTHLANPSTLLRTPAANKAGTRVKELIQQCIKEGKDQPIDNSVHLQSQPLASSRDGEGSQSQRSETEMLFLNKIQQWVESKGEWYLFENIVEDFLSLAKEKPSRTKNPPRRKKTRKGKNLRKRLKASRIRPLPEDTPRHGSAAPASTRGRQPASSQGIQDWNDSRSKRDEANSNTDNETRKTSPPGFNNNRASLLQTQYNANKKVAINALLGSPSPSCPIPMKEITAHFTKVMQDDTDPLDYLDTVTTYVQKQEMQDVTEGEILSEEVRNAFKGLSNTAPGKDGIRYNQLKAADPNGHILAAIYDICREWRRIPARWKHCNIHLIHKKGPPELISNWRPISLSPTIYKVYSRIWAKRLTSTLETTISQEQKGFIPKVEGCVEHIHTLDLVIGEAGKLDTDTVIIWIDLTNAFGSIPHHLIQHTMKAAGYSPALIEIINDMYHGAFCNITTAEGVSDYIEFTRGVKQGDPLSPHLFNLALEPVLRMIKSAHKEEGIHCHQQNLSILAYADDLVIFSNSIENGQVVLSHLERVLGEMGLTINPSKCGSMVVNKNGATDHAFQIGKENIPSIARGDSYSYLGKSMGLEVEKTPYLTIKGMVSDLLKIHNSDLSGWQKLDATKTFILPRLGYRLRTDPIPRTSLKELDRVLVQSIRKTCKLSNASSRHYIQGSVEEGGLGFTLPHEDQDIHTITAAFRLLTSTDKVIRDMAISDLKTHIQRNTGHIPDKDRMMEYLNGTMSTQTKWKGHGKSFWGEVRSSTRRLARSIKLRFTLDNELQPILRLRHPEHEDAFITIDGRKWVYGVLRRSIQHSHAASLANGYRNQGKTMSCTAQDQTSNQFMRDGRYISHSAFGFIHRARLNLLPINCRPGNRVHQQHCRRCPAELETLPHILCHCPRQLATNITARHNMILSRVVNALDHKKFPRKDIKVNQVCDVAGRRVRPDIVAMDALNKEIYIIDVTCAFESSVQAMEEVRQLKIAKYQPESLEWANRGYSVTSDAVVVGALGSWYPKNDQVLKKAGILSSDLRNLKRLIIEGAIEVSKSIFWEHVMGTRYFQYGRFHPQRALGTTSNGESPH